MDSQYVRSTDTQSHWESEPRKCTQGKPPRSETRVESQGETSAKSFPCQRLLHPQKMNSVLPYTHRVAISNHRIINVENGKVSFHYRDRKDNDTVKVMTLEADEFIRRFLLHVLPDGFMPVCVRRTGRRIRHFGFLANQTVAKNKTRPL